MWVFRLALALGRTAAEIAATVSSAELTDWIAYAEQEGPFWAARGDWQAAVIAQAVVACHAKQPPRLSDFLLPWARPKAEPLSAAGSRLAALEWAGAVNKGK